MRLPVSILPFVLAFGATLPAGLSGCLFGTSTDTENTVVSLSGTILLSDGRPAGGAVLSARTGEVRISPEGIPSWTLLAADTADAEGKFAFNLAEERELFLEIRERGDSPRKEYPEVLFARIARARAGDLDTFRLAPSGSVVGRLARPSGPLPDSLWIGVLGTSVLARAGTPDDSGGVAFRLDGLPPGSWPLEVVPAMPDTALPGDPPAVQVTPKAVTNQGSIYYDESGKGRKTGK